MAASEKMAEAVARGGGAGHRPRSDLGQGTHDLADTPALVAAFYHELRAIARRQLRDEWSGGSLQVTSLTHEAVIRFLARLGGERWQSTGAFFAAAAEAMRRIAVDAARRRKAQKRGGGRIRRDLGSLGVASADLDHEILLVDDVLDLLAEADGLAAEVVRLRYFGGLTVAETSTALGIPRRTIERRWAYARAWFGRHYARDTHS
jgi:RNA polymerase sigma factor (TIGR02999 family)